MATASISPIAERLKSVPSYHPLNADTFADWAMEAGDMITVSRDGQDYQSPVHSSRMVWRGKQQVSVESNGARERDPISTAKLKKYNKTNTGSAFRNNQELYWEMTSENGMLHSEIRVTAQSLTSDYTAKVGNMGVVLEGKIKQTAYSLTSDYTNKILQTESHIEQTASSITAYVQDTARGLEAGIRAGTNEAKLYAKSAENAAEIVARINESTGESEIHLDAQKVFIGNSRSTTVINGKLNVSDFTANSISAKLATLAQVVINGLNVLGDAYVRNGAGNQQNVSAAIWDIQLSGPVNNVYTLKRRRINEANYVDIGTFSRATTLSGAWNSGKFTVSASPQGNTFWTDLVQGATTWNGNTGTIPINAIDSDSGGRTVSTGRSVSVDATSIYNAGYADGQGSVSPTNLGIYDSNSNLVSGKTLSYEETFPVWAGYLTGGNWKWGSRVDIKAPPDRTKISSQSFNCSVTEEAGGSRYKYTLTASISSGVDVPLTDGSSYVLYK